MAGGYQAVVMEAGWPSALRVSVRRSARRPDGMPRIAATWAGAAARVAVTAVMVTLSSASGAESAVAAVPVEAAAMRAAAPGATMVSRPMLGMASPSVFSAPMTLLAVCMEMRQ